MKREFDPQDQDQVDLVKAMLDHGKSTSLLEEIYQKVRNQLKHGDCDNKEQLIQVLEEVKRLSSEGLFDE